MSQLEVDKIIPSSGTTLTIGDSGDTINISDGTALTVDTNTLAIDQANNRVGIGTSSPAKPLHVVGTGEQIRIQDNVNSGSSADIQLALYDSTSTRLGYISKFSSDLYIVNQENAGTIFYTNNSEKMRIDSSGNVLVGKTSANYTSKGVWLKGSDGQNYFTSESQPTIHINRLTNDGELIKFNKDGTTVGSIASAGGNDLEIIASNGIWLKNGNGAYAVWDGTNAFRPSSDNVYDIGRVTLRWDDIYATNGTIQTSDQNEKQSIQSLTTSEIAVAKRISKLFKTFKWNSAVEEKGDSARTHTGVIAQDVQQAFADEGLDASNYALFISSTWWEKEISVDAVAEELDEEGNVIVEGKEAYTYIDTKEEATEGYTERTRLGIRYPELLSFVSSAFEQRLTNIETRIEALENA